MPRKSTSASNRGTPRPAPSPAAVPPSAHKDTSRSSRKSRASLAVGGSSPDPLALSPEAPRPRKRRRPEEGPAGATGGQNGNAGPGDGAGAGAGAEGVEGAEGFTLEQQLEAWQEFAAEHYEMVEQLPLELHRNFRLLRELDDGCVSQSGKLQEQIRTYIDARLELVKRFAAVAEVLQGEVETGDVGGQNGMEVDEAEGPTAGRAAAEDGQSGAGDKEGQMEIDSAVQAVDEGQAEVNAPVDKEAEMAVDGQPEPAATIESAHIETSAEEPASPPQPASMPIEPTPAPGTDTQTDSTPAPPAATSPSAPPMPKLPPDMGSVISDGEGGLVVASSNDAPDISTEAESSTPPKDTVVAPSTEEVLEVTPSGTSAVADVVGTEAIAAGAVEGSGELATDTVPTTVEPVPSTEESGPVPTEVQGEGVNNSVPAEVTATVEAVQPVDLAPQPSVIEDRQETGSSPKINTVEGSDPAPPPTTNDPPVAPVASSSRLDLAALPSRFLPEIGRLSREVVRNCEEKVALAVGAYNSIDRHIRALDSALSAQETSLILGLRTDTLPSAGVDQTLGLAGDTSGIPQAEDAEEEGGMVLGLGGGAGGNRGHKRKDKRGKKRAVTEEEIVAEIPLGADPEMENINPNEPTYCYCNKVSYGTMIACDNEDCSLEWFHLPCTGLQVEPQGSWMCNICKPKVGLGMGGAGAVQPGGTEKKPAKKRKRI